MKKLFAWAGVGAFILAVFAVSAPSKAESACPLADTHEIDMVAVQSSYPSGYNGKIAAVVDDSAGGSVTGFHFTDSRGMQMNYSVDDLRKGVVLVQALGKQILKINGPDFTGSAGGPMVLSFLKGFMGSDRREVTFDYVRASGASAWVLETDDSQGHEPFDLIYVQVGTTVGIPTGVDEIDLGRGNSAVREYDPDQLPPSTFPSLDWPF